MRNSLKFKTKQIAHFFFHLNTPLNPNKHAGGDGKKKTHQIKNCFALKCKKYITVVISFAVVQLCINLHRHVTVCSQNYS